MNHYVSSVILGIIEGITEFLPISSTGHLLIAEKLGLGHRSDLFNVVIQAGAILALTIIYWKRLWSLATGFAKTREPRLLVETHLCVCDYRHPWIHHLENGFQITGSHHAGGMGARDRRNMDHSR